MTTIQKAPTKGTTLSDPKAAQQVLEEAMKQPGIRDLMEAYGEAKRFHDATEAYQAVLTARTVEWVSDSTAPACV